ncbi:NADH-quinone oxidoreductase subunit J [Propioniciclava soli]|uniref:NADH-quinone oxidoreductase subunit J n=1 Tax=Propioniciclava soli TaxID=2775081 RepID=A0ABZ3CA05_9ACTN|nr:NADH-quinone oxidoreductase subunit J [Propioniciclava soli]
MVPLVTGAEVTFWIAAPIAILGALGLVFARRAVYAALGMAVSMISLAVLYASMDAPFLAMIQVIVYTGAVMMMFLFVLMMVGVDTPDSVVETLKGQRFLAILAGIGAAALLVFAVGGAVVNPPVTTIEANAARGGNVEGLAELLFGRYVFVFELTSALLISGAVGAMLLAHHQRVTPKKRQREMAADRMAAYRTSGEHPGPLPNSGVYAHTNAIGAPALLPDGSVAEKSLSQTLILRGASLDAPALAKVTNETFAAIEAVADDDEDEE